jgi:hypothetical protein
MPRKSSAIDGPMLGRSVNKIVVVIFVLEGFISRCRKRIAIYPVDRMDHVLDEAIIMEA